VRMWFGVVEPTFAGALSSSAVFSCLAPTPVRLS
jgi:hypothetical protein